MKGSVRFVWVRHAPVAGHRGRVYGASDVSADVSDRAAFRGLAALLPGRAVAVTSGLKRTRQTLAAVGAAGWRAAEGPVVLPDLNEQNLGEWQGRPLAEVYGERAGHGRAGLTPARLRPPGGESFEDLLARVRPAVAGLCGAYPGRDLVVFAHGGTIRAALAAALDLSPERALAFSIATCSITRIDRVGDAWRVGCVNLPAQSGGRTSGETAAGTDV